METPLRPSTLYGICKNALWSIVSSYAQQANLTWLGVGFFFCTDRASPKRLVASVIRSLLADESVRCTAGTQKRDFLHVADAASALVALLRSDVEGAVNIGSGNTETVGAVVSRLAAMIGRPELIQFGALPMQANEPSLLVADTRRLRDEVRWQPQFDLDRGLADTLAWWRHVSEGISS